jgi:hypothetical protein
MYILYKLFDTFNENETTTTTTMTTQQQQQQLNLDIEYDKYSQVKNIISNCFSSHDLKHTLLSNALQQLCQYSNCLRIMFHNNAHSIDNHNENKKRFHDFYLSIF